MLNTPGHTPACVCYVVGEDCVFTGDTIFMPDFGTGEFYGGYDVNCCSLNDCCITMCVFN